MSDPSRTPSFQSQTGGVTILVALSLLVLLTVAAVSMSRNSFRDVIISGTLRQGSMVRNTSDAGVEWSIYWLDLKNAPLGTATAADLAKLKLTLLMDDTLSGKAYNVKGGGLYTTPSSISNLNSDQMFPTVGANYQGFAIALTRMGKMPITDMTQGITQGTYTPAQGGVSKQAPDLWAVRSDALLQVGTGMFPPTFLHSKEAWISTPVQ